MSQKKVQLLNPLSGNINVAGVITASSFVGSGEGLTGVASTDNIQTATEATFLSGVKITGVSTFNGTIVPNGAINFGGSSNLTLGDNNSLHVGDGIDLRILHSGGDSIINHAGTDGEFALLTTNEVRITNTGFAKTAAVFKPAGATELYHNHSKKFETTNTGAVVTGALTADSGSFSGNVSIGGTLTYQDVEHIDSVGIITAQQGIQVLANGLDVTGVSTFTGNILPEANGTRDLGATGTRWANIYTSDLDLSNEARGGNEVDGTWGSYTIQEGENDLFLINRRTGKTFKFVLEEIN